MMKILFLDIDGVLNNANFIQSGKSRSQREIENQSKYGRFSDDDSIGYYAADIDPTSLDKLRTVWTYHPDTKIVISSSWRQLMSHHQIKDIFCYFGWKDSPIIDKTPSLTRHDIDPTGQTQVLRGHEIKAWIESSCQYFTADKRTIQHPTYKYAILDDDSDFLEGQPLVQTSWETGLLDEHVTKVCQILSN